MGSCEHGNEFLGSVKGGEFFDKLSNCLLLKKDSAVWNWFHSRQILGVGLGVRRMEPLGSGTRVV
jgi:hypothetical protein